MGTPHTVIGRPENIPQTFIAGDPFSLAIAAARIIGDRRAAENAERRRRDRISETLSERQRDEARAADNLTPLRRARLDKEWTQAELAERAGVAQSTLRELELGRREPSPVTLLKLAAALAADPRTLLG